ncbi:efflux transporter outer membrane subunit [Methylophilus sp. 5]|uniref:efflux transporter outer membrane subunit n=1 Tax=Methylophilus sp. 5 TaxID=1112274 RepID=UPI001E2AFFC5|nr:efflux transporter outer membrane subunit [Methylophilus sp. 5]
MTALLPHNHASMARWSVCLLALLLNGCISSKGIAPVSQPLAQDKLALGKAIDDAAVIAWPTEHWWQAYQDAQLDRLVEKSLHDQPDLKKATARIALSTAMAEQAHAATLPNVGGKVSSSRERFTELSFIPKPWAGRFNWNNQATVAMSYDLDLWKQQKSAWQAALDETKVTEAEMQQVKIELTAAMVKSYVRLAAEYQWRDLAQEELEDVRHEIGIAKKALAAGLNTQLNLSRLEATLPAAQNKLAQIDLHLTLLKNQMAALSGDGPGAGDAIVRPTLHLSATIGLPDHLPANLVGRRPDIVAARWRVEAAQKHIQSAKAAFYPNINLLGYVGFQALAFSGLFSSAGLVGNFGPAMSLPIFDGGKRRANLSAETAMYDMAVEDYNATILKALEGISNQLSVLNTVADETGNTQQALDKTEQAHRLAVKNYRAGLSNLVESLQTNALVLQQKSILVEQEAVRLEAYATLMLALGGGVIDADHAAQAVH